MDYASRHRRGAPRGDSSAPRAEDHDSLQDRLGNQAVQRLAAAGVQARLEVGPVDDAHEREADQVADHVMAGDHAGDVRQRMEAKTGASLDGVRIHDDAESHQMAADVGAHAFTHGKDIHFAEGAYDPGSRAGQHLIAHELTHVVQQSGGQAAGIQRKAISAAPSSIQRLWNPFKKKSKPQVQVPELTDLDLLHRDNAGFDDDGNEEHREHWLDWNKKKGNDSPIINDHNLRNKRAFAGMSSSAESALSILPDEEIDVVLAKGDVMAAQYRPDLLSSLERWCQKEHLAEYRRFSTEYRRHYDAAKAILVECASGCSDSNQVNWFYNVGKQAGLTMRAVAQLDYVTPEFFGDFLSAAGLNGGGGEFEAIKNYQSDEGVQDYYRKNG